jgi:hypothetical protein
VRSAGLPLAVLLLACAGGDAVDAHEPAREETSERAVADPGLLRAMARIDSAADAIDAVFQPLPLLTAADEDALRRFGNSQQLERARALGIQRRLPDDRLDALERDGRLVRLVDGEHWIVREMDHARPLAVPAVTALLTRIGERFHARLAALGAPAFRMEVTSVLRTLADQEALRRVNPNAAAGESTHEYGTTVDVLYSAFAAPARPIVEIDATAETEPFLRRYAEIAAERVAARRALELKAILGRVLLEMQREGSVMVTLERQQPVFHMTVARTP